MSRKKAIGMIDEVVKEAQSWAEDCPNQQYHFWAHCSLPQWQDMIEDELRPWYARIWLWLRCLPMPWHKLDDQIPF